MSAFNRYIGIDYSGAALPVSGLKGLRVYAAELGTGPVEVLPLFGRSRYWSRRGMAEWLLALLSDGVPTVVGIDHGFSFPKAYLDLHGLSDWPSFLADFVAHWPTDGDAVSVEMVRRDLYGRGAARQGNSRWRRLAEVRCRAKSVFHFDVQGSVAKSTHAGLPWLLFLRQRLGGQVHFWPFDGWTVPAGCSVIAEAYPSLWRKAYPMPGLTADQQDAHAIAAWLRDADADGRLDRAWVPALSPRERDVAAVEGWVLGVC